MISPFASIIIFRRRLSKVATTRSSVRPVWPTLWLWKRAKLHLVRCLSASAFHFRAQSLWSSCRSAAEPNQRLAENLAPLQFLSGLHGLVATEVVAAAAKLATRRPICMQQVHLRPLSLNRGCRVAGPPHPQAGQSRQSAASAGYPASGATLWNRFWLRSNWIGSSWIGMEWITLATNRRSRYPFQCNATVAS